MLNPEAVSKAMEAALYDRNKALTLSVERKEEVESKLPRIKEIARELSAVGAGIAKSFYSPDPQARVEALAAESLRLQAEKAQLLKAAGFSEDYLDPPFYCKRCEDTGRGEGGRLCDCIRERAIRISLEELAHISPSEHCSFENFSLDYYKDIKDKSGNSVYRRAQSNFQYLKAYSEDFSPNSKSLYIFGKTGLGKTHLTLAVANAVIRKGYYVIYGMAGALFSSIEEEKFRGISGKYSMKNLLGCDLLIIDDLGSEFKTSFSASVVHNIIESRLLANKPVIITTNLDINAIHAQYGERIASRIIGEYVPIKFDGADIRQLKKFQY